MVCSEWHWWAQSLVVVSEGFRLSRKSAPIMVMAANIEKPRYP